MQLMEENPETSSHNRVSKTGKPEDQNDGDDMGDVIALLETSLSDFWEQAKAEAEGGIRLGSSNSSWKDKALREVLNDVLHTLQQSRLKADYQPSVLPGQIVMRDLPPQEKREIKSNFLEKNWGYFLKLS
jgi:hypothetical protein